MRLPPVGTINEREPGQLEKPNPYIRVYISLMAAIQANRRPLPEDNTKKNREPQPLLLRTAPINPINSLARFPLLLRQS